MRPEAKERARAYVGSAKTPDAIAGQNGDKTTYAVACTLAVDFGLDDGDVRELLGIYNATKCRPQWSERDIERFVRSARRTANGKPAAEIGKLLNVDREDYSGPRSPANKPATKPAASKPANAPPRGLPSASGSQRTVRTPLFSIREPGEGAEHRTARTERTLAPYSNPYLSASSSLVSNKSKKEVSGKSATQAPVPATKAPSEPSAAKPAPAEKPKPSAPAEKLDKYTEYKDGRRFRKRYGEKEWTRLDKPPGEAPSSAAVVAVAFKPTVNVTPGACPECWRYGKAIPLAGGVCPICTTDNGRKSRG